MSSIKLPSDDNASHTGHGKRPLVIALLAIVIVVVSFGVWVGRTPARRDRLVTAVKEMAAKFSRAQGVPVEQAPALPVVQDDDTQAAQQTMPTETAPANDFAETIDIDAQPAPDAATEDAAAVQPQAQAPPPEQDGEVARGIVKVSPREEKVVATGRTDDAVVRVTFIEDMAQWLVNNYRPGIGGGDRGSIVGGIQSANARYGLGMKGLAWMGDDMETGRLDALGYIYSSGMLESVYRLYIGRFMDAVTVAATRHGQARKPLTPAQTEEMLKLYASRFKALSGALQGICALPDLPRRMNALRNATDKVMQTNSAYMEDMFAFSQAMENNDRKTAESARVNMEATSEAYHRAIQSRDALRESITSAVRSSPSARLFSDDDIIFVASWVDRRLRQSTNAIEASKTAAKLFQDIGERFENAALKHL
jgi:hypothetical protein